jgi:hypothetical protein
MRILVESPHPPDECRDRLSSAFGGQLRFRWSTISRGEYSDRVVGRVDGDRIAATLIHGTSGRISWGRFGRQILGARIEPSGFGSTITGAIRYPYLDRTLYSVVLAAVCLAVTADPVSLTVAPLSFAVFWVYENRLAPQRLRQDADYLLSGLITLVDGRVFNVGDVPPSRHG